MFWRFLFKKILRGAFPKAVSIEMAKRCWQLAYFKLNYPRDFYKAFLKHCGIRYITEEFIRDTKSLDTLINDTLDCCCNMEFVDGPNYVRERRLEILYLYAEAKARGIQIEELLAC